MSGEAKVLVGTCGFPMSRRKYYDTFDTVELQDTFYNPPNLDRLSKLRNEAPTNFIFNMKAWQAITHPPSMPTWRRSKFKPPKELWDKYGFLRPTKENFETWEQIKEAAKVINARVVVIQLPSSFKCNEENLRNAKEFLASITSSNFFIGLELRGEWIQQRGLIEELISVNERVIHVVDPFRADPVVLKDISYLRLHGIGGKDINYKYKYTNNDLNQLKKKIEDNIIRYSKEVYVMFNNIYMKDDALRFKNIFLSIK